MDERVLFVEDDRSIREVAALGMERAGFRVTTAPDGREGLLRFRQDPFDAVVLDVMLPGMSGFEVCRRLRQDHVWVPVLMLTARASVSDRVSGLDAGADDYIPKPFEITELLARVKALLRRASMAAASVVLHVRDVALDPISRRVEKGGVPVELTQKEYSLLEYLMRNAGRAVTRQQIAEHVWHQASDPGTNVVDVYINYLRKKLGDERDNPLIRTVRGVGYMIEA
jgi:two-component system OmpR family response regulator